jgi:hypothetical protein
VHVVPAALWENLRWHRAGRPPAAEFLTAAQVLAREKGGCGVNVLMRLPAWARALLLAANLLAAAAVLAAFWDETFPNLIASWVIGAVVAAVAVPATAWVTHRLDARQDRAAAATAEHLAAHRDAITRAVDRQLAEHRAQITRELAEHHDRLRRTVRDPGA